MLHRQTATSAVTAVLIFAWLALLAGCSQRSFRNGSSGGQTLNQARKGHATRLARFLRDGVPAPDPPKGDLRLVKYPTPQGSYAAYVSEPPRDGKQHPAILWIFGGFDNGIGDTAWAPATPDNDQSARVFRRKGIVTMYPSFRGGNDNPNFREGLYSEVDDVIAAAKWLAAQPYVDPKRIYLGGHSTGGTLALLVSESTGGFRAVFAFGAVDDIRGYGQDELPFDIDIQKEAELRSPGLWLHCISRPTYVFEGTDGNIEPLRAMATANRNPNVHFFEFPGYDHFSILAAITPLVADQIVNDTGPEVNMAFRGTPLGAPLGTP
jgi:hypothetical protein